MNHTLAVLHEDLNMLGRFCGEDAAAKTARHRRQKAGIARTGCHFGLTLHTAGERIHCLLPGRQAAGRDQRGADGRREYTITQVAAMLGVSRPTLYRALEPRNPTSPLPR
jgi:hypothetical protein